MTDQTLWHFAHAQTPLEGAACRTVIKERLDTLKRISMLQPRVTNLARFLDSELLQVVGKRLRRRSASGIDKVSPRRYRQNLQANINQLITEVKNKSYQPSPSRRYDIPKDDGTSRSLGLPTIRDKHLQGAVLKLLEAVYEPHFYTHSYGFRPKRSCKMAVQVLQNWLTLHHGAWVLEVDLSKFFDTIPHEQLLEVISERIGDRKILHLINAWLKAGVMEEGVLIPSEMGTPQGGVISPLAANVYLDKALDQWITKTYFPALTGEALLVRYADDFVLAFTDETECRQAAEDVTSRLEEFGLTVNQKKTKLTDLREPDNSTPGAQEIADINFLGFSLYWRHCPNTGWQMAARTSEKSIKRFKERLSSWLMKCGEMAPSDLTAHADAMLKGHRTYFDVTGNEDGIALAEEVRRSLCESHLRPVVHPTEVMPMPQQPHAPVPDEDHGVGCQFVQ